MCFSEKDMVLNRRFVLALLGATALVACAPVPNSNPIGREARKSLTFSEIRVSTSGTAFESTRAADHSSSLGPDLQAFLSRELSDRMNPGGVVMEVDIARLNVAGSTTTTFGRDKSLLQGSVRVNGLNGDRLGTYQINVVAGDAAETRTGALVGAITHTGEGYYRSLLDAFARDTREQVLGTELPGQRLIRKATQ